MSKEMLCSMGCEVVCWAEPTVVIGLWLVKERELSWEFSPSDKRWATPNPSSSNNNQWPEDMTQSSCIVRTVGAHAGSSADLQPPSWRNQNEQIGFFGNPFTAARERIFVNEFVQRNQSLVSSQEILRSPTAGEALRASPMQRILQPPL